MRRFLLTSLILLFTLPSLAHAALVNINTADATLLDTLPGIGPSKATAIVEYRTGHGPFTRIEDIQSVSGIGPSTYADIAPLITVGDTTVPSAPTPESATSTVVTSGASTYTPPPSAISVRIDGDQNAILEVPLHLFAHVTTKGGVVDSVAQISWSFGDGSSATGSEVDKAYRYPGTYMITVHAIDGSAKAYDELSVTAKQSRVRILSITGEGITLVNDGDERLDLSNWKLLSEASSFRIPVGMLILPRTSALLPFTVTNLPIISSDVRLLYPNNVMAARFVLSPTATASAQPLTEEAGYRQVQKVEPIIRAKTDVDLHEKEAVIAPVMSTKLATTGASLPPKETMAVAHANGSSLFRSPWTYGFLGIMLTAAGAFILL